MNYTATVRKVDFEGTIDLEEKMKAQVEMSAFWVCDPLLYVHLTYFTLKRNWPVR